MYSLIFDATTLIHLAKADLHVHLKDLDHELLLPLSIYDEVVLEGKRNGHPDALKIESLVLSGTLNVEEVLEGQVHSLLKANTSLSGADLDVMELARLKDGIAIMDETYGRMVCDVEKIRHKGTIWIIRQFLFARSISKEEAREGLDRLIDEGWYCSTRFYSKAIRSFEGTFE